MNSKLFSLILVMSSPLLLGAIVHANEDVYKIDKPTLGQAMFSNPYFSTKSDPDGVCLALGYAHALGAPTTDSSASGPAIIVNRNGEITGGELITSQKGYWIKQIFCANKISEPLYSVEMISDPAVRMNGGELNLSNNSDVEGYCRIKGYDHAVPKLMEVSGRAIGDVAVLNDRGEMVNTEKVTSNRGYWISKLVCYNYSTVTKQKAQVEDLASKGAIDIAVYNSLRKQGYSHEQALAQSRGPAWTDLSEANTFLSHLSEHLYNFDKHYVSEIQKLMNDSKPGTTSFLCLALMPYLENLGYDGLKTAYLNDSLARMKQQFKSANLNSVFDIESSRKTRVLTVKLLAISLQTGMPQMSGDQKNRADVLLRQLTDAAASGMNLRSTIEFLKLIPDFRMLELELAQNPYLRSRATADMQLLNYLENS